MTGSEGDVTFATDDEDGAQGIDVWQICTSVNLEPAMLAVLSGAEAERAAQFHAERDRHRFIVAHAALRDILSGYAGVPPGALQFEYGPAGKPALTDRLNCPALRFNLSHSGNMALCAVTRGGEVGVDVEEHRDDCDAARIAAQFFSPSEQLLLRESQHSPRVFVRLWVRKEAFLKATGDGIGSDLRAFSVTLADTCEIASPSDGRAWTVRELEVAQGFAAAVATPGRQPRRVRRFVWDARVGNSRVPHARGSI